MSKKSTHRNSRLIPAVALAALGATSIPARAADVLSSWTAGVSGNWSVAGNWTNIPAVVQYPNNGNGGFTYDASIDLNGTITLTESIVLQQLNLKNATIDGDFNIQINQFMGWDGGGMRGNGTTTIAVGATLDLLGPARKSMTRTIDNFGTTNWFQGGLTGDTFAALGVFNNKAGATFNANSDFVSQGAFGIGSVSNAGTMIKGIGNETRFGGITKFSNTGTLIVRAGAVRIVGEVAQSTLGSLSAGTWIVDATNGPVTLMLDQSTLSTLGPAADVELIGPNSTFLAVDSINTNAGRFRIAGGRKFATLGALTNSGTITVGAGSALDSTGTLTNAGTIDVNGGLIARYTTTSPRLAIEAQIVHARNGGAWNQDGITSSAARTASPPITTLGVLEGTQYQALYGAGAPFFGQTTDNTSVLVRYTYYGDTDFNGKVDGSDYARIDTTFNNQVGQGNIGGWFNGDLDYNGKVDGADYALIDSAFNAQSGVIPAGPAGGMTALAPEPSLLLTAPLLLLLPRRQRRA